MHFLFLIGMIITGSLVYANPPAYLTTDEDGNTKIVFPHKNDIVVSTGAVTESPIPTATDINIATCSYRFSNYSDFLLTYKKKGAKRQIILIRQRLNELTDQPNSDPEVIDLKERIDWLKSYKDSL